MAFVRQAALLCFIIATLASAPRPAGAQTLDHALRGLSKLRLAVESLDPFAAQCRVNVAAIRDSLSQPLLATGINIVPRSEDRDAIFYISVNILYFA